MIIGNNMKRPYLIDLPATIDFHAQAHDVCDCAYCENFRLAFKAHPINNNHVFKEFGFSLQGEMEIMDLFWNDTRTKRVYEVFYAIQGELMEDGYRFECENVVVTLFKANSPKLCYDLTKMKQPFFFLVLHVELPWLLKEPPMD